MSDQPTGTARGETSQTLDRGLRLLEILAAEPEGMTAQALASRLEIHRTVSYRLLNTLLEHRLVQRMQDGRYKLGTGLIELARRILPQLQSAAVPELKRLAEELGATTHLTTANGNEAIVLTTIEPSHTHMHVVYRPGFRHALDQGASGIAILAGRPAQATERNQIVLARQRGYAISQNEIQSGASGLAVPLMLNGTPLEASIGVIVLGTIDEARISPRVLAAARRITALL
ncbi:transcriptional regulator [Dictyobacter vulcani]|uniref:Transcriptional regulator n=1 Tax=Dictyobacter vulcani TaxID=2607529 RepID=A0A5J4KV63_9CHLR|nr:IclR family transcriptional regulator [Dictyobacter vulcani]GER91493.1 transcriptional regulator [Dictyobacter vulcani]